MAVNRFGFQWLIAGALMGAPAAWADNNGWPVARGPSREPRPFRYDSKILSTVPKDYLEDAAACVLYAGNSHTVEPDGTIETTTHEITRLNGRKGVEKLGEYRNITFDPTFQKLTLNTAILHKADGRQLEVEPRHLQIRDVSTDFLIYDRQKQLIISFPNLEVNDTLEVKWTLRGKNPEHGGKFFTRYSFGDTTYPVVRDELMVRVPVAMPLKFDSPVGDVQPSVSTVDGQRLYLWRVDNAPEPPQDENLPSKEELHPTVVCSTFASWEEVGVWERKIRGDCWKAEPEIQKLVAEITHDLHEPLAKARALTTWLRRNIRYVSSGEKHDFTPHPPASTLANRYGDCKDTSQLLAVMLREAGLPVSLATLGALDDGQIVESVPSPWGSHAILFVTLPDGEHWIDTTLTLAAWDYLPRDDRERLCYLVDSDGRISLKRTPPLTPDDIRYEQTTEVRIDLDGNSHCDRTIVAQGGAAVTLRDNFLDTPAGERRRLVATELQDANSKAHLQHLILDEKNLRALNEPARARIQFDITGHFTGDPDREGAISDSRTWSRLLAFNLDYDREMPFELPTPIHSRHRYIVHLPLGFVLESLPQSRQITSKWGTFSIGVDGSPSAGSTCEVLFELILEETRVEPEDFAEFRKFHEAVSKAYRVWLTLHAQYDLADVPILESVLTLAPQDAAAAAALVRLYQRNGKSAEARRALARACAYAPANAALCELQVSLAATPAEELQVRRDLAHRYPGEPRYQLELASALARNGQHQECEKMLQPLLRLGGPADCAAAHVQLAVAMEKLGRRRQALDHLQEAEMLDSTAIANVETLALRARLWEAEANWEKAADAWQRVLLLHPNADQALLGLARISLELKNSSGALKQLRKYVVAVADDADRLAAAAELYLRLERWDDAEELAAKAKAKGCRSEVLNKVLGLLNFRRGQWQEVIKHLNLANQNAETAAAFLVATLKSGNLTELPVRLDMARRISPATPNLVTLMRKAQEALQWRDELAKKHPTANSKAQHSGSLDSVACAAFALDDGDRATAKRLLTASIYDIGEVDGLRAQIDLDEGKLRRASEEAGAAIEKAPKNWRGYYVRGKVRLEREQPGALADLEKAHQLGGSASTSLLHALADALFRDGQRERAVQCQREAVRLRPLDQELCDQLAEFEKAAPAPGRGS